MNFPRLALAVVVMSTVACESEPFVEDDPIVEDPSTYVASIEGAVIDWETGLPVEGASVVVELGWLDPTFPTDSEGFATLSTDADGRFGPVDVLFDDGRPPAFLLLRVSGQGLAQTASDLRMTCETGPSPRRCEAVDHTIVAPSSVVATGWREQLVADGATESLDTGLVLFEYLEADGSPASNVEAEVINLDGFEAGSTRYLADDGLNLDALTATTTTSGLALVALDRETAFVRGEQGEREWKTTGVLAAPGWIFVEDRTVTQ